METPDPTTDIPFSPVFITYIIIIFFSALGCLYHKLFIRKDKNFFMAPSWQGPWTHFGLLLFSLVAVLLVLPSLSSMGLKALGGDSLTKEWQSVFPGLVTQLGLLFSIVGALNLCPDAMGTNITNFKTSPIEAVTEGIYRFFWALPIVWGAGLIWNGLALYLQSRGWNIEFERQALVDIFAESNDLLFLGTIFFFSIVVAPLSEELFFRVMLYRFLKSKINRIAALLISATIFACVHFHFLSFLPLLVLGILMANAYEKTGNPLTSITFHSLFNLNTLVMLILQPNVTLLG